MKFTYKYRLFPTKKQYTAMQKVLDAARWVYNQTLEMRQRAWEERQESLRLYDTNKMLPKWKADNPWLKQANAQVLQNAQMRVDLAFKSFFRRVKAGEKPGYPRFRGRGHYDSFTYPQGGFKFLDNGYLYLSKIGKVHIKFHRSIKGQIKTLTVRRNRLGNWFACFSCDVETEPLPPSPNIAGVDVGLTHFVTISTSERISNPRFFREDEKVLAKAQRKLSNTAKETPEYDKRKRVIQHIYQRISNRRNDFAHKLSRRLVGEFQIIAFENLDIQDMQNGNFRGINKSIGDAAWRQFIQYTIYKAESAGRSVVLVDPFNTTQMCSGCGEIVRKGLSERVHSCPHCGLEIDRDHNAALNILARGLACMGSNP